MTHRVWALALAGAFVLAASGARAGTLTSATWTTELPGITPNIAVNVPVLGSGTSTSASVSVSLVLPPFQTGVFGTGGAINTFRSLTLSGSQMLTVTANAAVATMGVPGEIAAKVAFHVAKGANASMLAPGPTTLFRIPLSVGVIGVATDYFSVSAQAHYLTLDFYAWSPGVQTFTGLTSMFSALPSVMATGSFNLTAMGGGSVLLVAPTRVSLDGSLSQRRGVLLSTLQLQFVPEPSALLLLGVGGLALLLAARRNQL